MGPLMHHYELLYIVPARHTDAELETVNSHVRALIQKLGGAVVKATDLGKIRLAYPVAGTQYGTYRQVVFTAPPAQLASIRHSLKLMGELARFEIVKTTEDRAARMYTLTAYQEPALQGPREREMRPRSPRAPAPRPAPPAAKPITEEELDKQIDKIIEEKIL